MRKYVIWFSTKSIGYRKLRSLLVVLSIFIGISLFMTLDILSKSVVDYIAYRLMTKGVDRQILVSMYTAKPEELEYKVRMIPHVVLTYVYRFLPCIVEYGGMRAKGSYYIVPIKVDELKKVYPGIKVLKGMLSLSSSTCVIGYGIYQWYKAQGVEIKVGDTITYITSDGKKRTCHVMGILDFYGTATLVGSPDYTIFLERIPGIDLKKIPSVSLVIIVDSRENVDIVAEYLKKYFNVENVVKGKDLIEALLYGMQQVAGLFQMVALFSLIVAILMVGSTMYTIVLERTRIYGLLMALGATKKELMASVILEAVVLGLLGFIPAVPVAISAAHVLLTHESMGLPEELRIPLKIDPMTFVEGAIITLLASVLGSAYSAYMVSKIEPAQALRVEAL